MFLSASLDVNSTLTADRDSLRAELAECQRDTTIVWRDTLIVRAYVPVVMDTSAADIIDSCEAYRDMAADWQSAYYEVLGKLTARSGR